jgi:hypothetical protein
MTVAGAGGLQFLLLSLGIVSISEKSITICTLGDDGVMFVAILGKFVELLVE